MLEERDSSPEELIDPPSNDGGTTAPQSLESSVEEASAKAIDPPANDGGH
jgi:hypothetical protein